MPRKLINYLENTKLKPHLTLPAQMNSISVKCKTKIIQETDQMIGSFLSNLELERIFVNIHTRKGAVYENTKDLTKYFSVLIKIGPCYSWPSPTLTAKIPFPLLPSVPEAFQFPRNIRVKLLTHLEKGKPKTQRKKAAHLITDSL